MNTLEIFKQNNQNIKSKNSGGLFATIVKIFYSKRKFNYCVNFLTKEQISTGSYICADGFSKALVVEVL